MSPWKPLWTHPCQTLLAHLERPPAQLNCHLDDEIQQELVIVNMNYKVWVGIDQSRLGVDSMKNHWQWVQGQNLPNPFGSVNAPKPTFATLKLVPLFHNPQGQSYPVNDQE